MILQEKVRTRMVKQENSDTTSSWSEMWGSPPRDQSNGNATRKNIFCQKHLSYWSATSKTRNLHLLNACLSALILLKNLIVSNNMCWQRRNHQRGPRERQLLLDGGESSPDEVQTGLQHTSFRRQWATKISPWNRETFGIIWPYLWLIG